MKKSYKDLFFLNISLLIVFIIFLFSISLNIPPDTERFLYWIKNTYNFSLKENLNYLTNQKGGEGVFFLISLYIFKFFSYLVFNIKILFQFLNIFVILLAVNFIYLRFKLNLIIYIPITILVIFINYEFSQWIYIPLTDLFFFSLVFFVIFFYNEKKYLLTTFLFFIALFTKPTGINLVIIFIQLLFYENFFKNKNFYLKFILFNILLIIIVNVILYYDLQIPILKDRLGFLNQNFNEGIIVIDRPYHNVDFDGSLLDQFKIFTFKIIFFFKFTDIKFSFFHNVVNLVVFSILYASTFLSLFYKDVNKKDLKLIHINLLVIMSYAVFHSITWIDYDWRFRGVIILPLFANLIIYIKNLKILTKNEKN